MASADAGGPSALLFFLHNSACGLSIVFNALLCFLIARHNPAHLRPYSIMLLCVYEMSSAIAGACLFARIISLGGEGLICVYYGPCRHIHAPRVCYALYGILLNGLTFYNVQNTASLSYRYYVLLHASPTFSSTLALNFIISAPTIICLILFQFEMSQREVAEPLIDLYLPQYDFSQAHLLAMVDPLHSMGLPSIAWVIGTSLPCLFLNIHSGRAIHLFLDSASTLAEKTKSMHREFLKLGEVCIAISPLVTMCFVMPYRRTLLRFLSLEREPTRHQNSLASLIRVMPQRQRSISLPARNI